MGVFIGTRMSTVAITFTLVDVCVAEIATQARQASYSISPSRCQDFLIYDLIIADTSSTKETTIGYQDPAAVK